jgi:hypothetical protein
VKKHGTIYSNNDGSNPVFVPDPTPEELLADKAFAWDLLCGVRALEAAQSRDYDAIAMGRVP